jgi:hypothetical protein
MTDSPELIKRDLGHNQAWSKTFDKDGNWIGILEWHECQDAQNTGEDGRSAGGVYFTNASPDLKGPRWTLVNEAPITISPSILCRSCGNHGFITNGKWVPA